MRVCHFLDSAQSSIGLLDAEEQCSYFYLCVGVTVCGNVYLCAGAMEARNVNSPGTGVIGGCESLLWVLRIRLKSFERATVLFTYEPSLQPP